MRKVERSLCERNYQAKEKGNEIAGTSLCFLDYDNAVVVGGNVWQCVTLSKGIREED